MREHLPVVLSPLPPAWQPQDTHTPLLPKHTTQFLRAHGPKGLAICPDKSFPEKSCYSLAGPDWAMPCPLLVTLSPGQPREQGTLALMRGAMRHAHMCTEGHACVIYAGRSQKRAPLPVNSAGALKAWWPVSSQDATWVLSDAPNACKERLRGISLLRCQCNGETRVDLPCVSLSSQGPAHLPQGTH